MAIQLVVLALLLSWTFEIIRPFINPFLWAVIIAVALEPVYIRALRFTNGRIKLTATLLILVFAIMILVPAFFLMRSAIRGAMELKEKYEAGEITIPDVHEGIQDWPVVGKSLYELWDNAAENLTDFVSQYQEEIISIVKSFLSALVGTGTGVLEMVLALIIGIILLATKGTQRAGEQFFTKLAGTFGVEFARISQATIRNVVKGVLGVAVIQSILIGLAFLLAGIPYAGVWALIVLVLSIIQLPPMLVTIPVIIYLFATRTGLSASMWTILILLAGASDNILKPILMGKGSESPMLVIFFGSLGGFLAFGFIGLFVGAIVLALVYKLTIFWLSTADDNGMVEKD